MICIYNQTIKTRYILQVRLFRFTVLLHMKGEVLVFRDGHRHSDTSSQQITPLSLGPTVQGCPFSSECAWAGWKVLAPCKFGAICVWKVVLPSPFLLLVFAILAKQCFMFSVPVVTVVVHPAVFPQLWQGKVKTLPNLIKRVWNPKYC